MRGLFGVDWDARSKTLEVNPHLPEEWESAKLHNLQIGSMSLDLDMQRKGGALRVRALTKKPEKIMHGYGLAFRQQVRRRPIGGAYSDIASACRGDWHFGASSRAG